MTDRRKRPFGGLRPPAPPAALRDRALAAGREAAAADPRPAHTDPARSLTDRLWESRPLRFAWAGLVAALLAFNLYLDRGAPGGAPSAAATPVPPGTLTLIEARGLFLGERPANRRYPAAEPLHRSLQDDPS